MPASVVIVTRNPDRWLEPCLESVAEQAGEVIVVDNESAGETCARLCAKYGARHLRQDANLGFALGVNIGAKAARTDHIALINDDAFAGEGWLQAGVDALRDETIGAVVPKLVFADRRAIIRLEDPVSMRSTHPLPFGRHVTSLTVGEHDMLGPSTALGSHLEAGGAFWTTGATMVVLPLPNNETDVKVNGEPVEIERTFTMVNNAGSFLHPGGWAGDIGFAQRDDGSFDTPVDRFAACGAAMIVRRETWERLGGLAEDFFAYYEDTDWSWRAQLAGLRIRYEPGTEVRHVHAQTGGAGSPWFQFFVARNRMLCLARNAPRRVVADTLARRPPLPPGVLKSLGKQLPSAMRERRRLSRTLWTRTPEEVWAQWAGVGIPQ